ncbi:diaminopimelate epimerase [Candidatus Omnitrophus magneticus]|uniref:Diaminopimelate epimerase n=1 Tax=Candidatus Omnitrophus magneticus TaxID=1609969 RepID=A0A0F0CU54_9BACT|nr:diaminopimelate epimerase [Candidatus Omnitrophus magneticus]
MKKIDEIIFTKAVASGNDFIIIDNKARGTVFDSSYYSDLARSLCERHLSIGADGILAIEKSDRADYRMRIINPDGSEVNMCGNGARCAMLYAYKKGWGNNLTFETGAGILEGNITEFGVKIKMTEPRDFKKEIFLEVDGEKIKAHFIDTGVPHVVCMMDDIKKVDAVKLGRIIRGHNFFAPRGTNVNFVGDITKNGATVRTYERGVEDETLACGTGSVASAVILGLLGVLKSPVEITTKSGEKIKVYYKIISNEKVIDVYMEGKAQIIFEGRVV